MRLDLAERLRCPNPHVPTPMVVVARAKREFELMTGFAGCPVCHLEARFEDGHLRFAPKIGDGLLAEESVIVGPWWEAELERTIALLGLAEPGGAVLLTGRYARLAEMLAAAVDTSVVVMGVRELPLATDRVAGVEQSLSGVPFTDGTFRAAAVCAHSTTAFMHDAVRTVAPKGRLLVPVNRTMPPGLKELARDEQESVSEREVAGAMVELGRRKPEEG